MLHVKNISFNYNPDKDVLKNVSFALQPGEHLCIMGKSGCGKSTLLKAIYGLLDLGEGTILWNDKQILGPSFHLIPGMPFVKYVAQNFDLMPYISVAENIAKFLSRSNPEELASRTQELLNVTEMEHLANAKVKDLSGGQQQRVAIARALANEPELLLLDEPFNQVDNFKKNTFRRKLFEYLKYKKITCIVATHDAHDALSFADKMLVIKDNTILANEHPKKLYETPPSFYVASLFDDVSEVILNGEASLLYPHQIKIVEDSPYEAFVVASYFKGFYWLVKAIFNGRFVFMHHNTEIQPGKQVFISFKH